MTLGVFLCAAFMREAEHLFIQSARYGTVRVTQHKGQSPRGCSDFSVWHEGGGGLGALQVKTAKLDLGMSAEAGRV